MSDPRVEKIRRAIMASMAFTELKHGGFTHDDYDDAHAALESLAAEHRAWREALEQIASNDVPTVYGGGHHAARRLARVTLAARSKP